MKVYSNLYLKTKIWRVKSIKEGLYREITLRFLIYNHRINDLSNTEIVQCSRE